LIALGDPIAEDPRFGSGVIDLQKKTAVIAVEAGTIRTRDDESFEFSDQGHFTPRDLSPSITPQRTPNGISKSWRELACPLVIEPTHEMSMISWVEGESRRTGTD
jgi:hypothetical protein